MKRIGLTLAVFCMLSAATFAAETYSSKEHSFTLEIPAKWDKKERVSGAAVTVIAPRDENKDAFRANVNVIEQDIPLGIDLKKFADASLSVMDKLLKGYKEAERAEISIGALQAVRVVFTYQHEDLDLKAVLVLAISGKHGYAITCTADGSNFEKQKRAFDEVVKSFKVQ